MESYNTLHLITNKEKKNVPEIRKNLIRQSKTKKGQFN